MRRASLTIAAALTLCGAIGACAAKSPANTAKSVPAATSAAPTADVPPAPLPAPEDIAVSAAEAAAPPVPPAPPATLQTLFPGVRIDAARRIVEFDGQVPFDFRANARQRAYIEVIACAFNSKEHEALVVTRAIPSHVHAALLAVGFNPGAPGRWDMVPTPQGPRLEPVAPTGDAITVAIAYTDSTGAQREDDPAEWIIHAETGRPLRAVPARPTPAGAFVFSGSKMAVFRGNEIYEADIPGEGLIVGLASFGGEVVSWREMLHPDAAVQPEVWIADPARVPPPGTRVVVRIRPAGRSSAAAFPGE